MYDRLDGMRKHWGFFHDKWVVAKVSGDVARANQAAARMRAFEEWESRARQRILEISDELEELFRYPEDLEVVKKQLE